jgi:hypothetical protein
MAGNMTAARHFESTHRFKTLARWLKNPACFRKREVVFTGSRTESFPLRETDHAVSL